MSGHVVSLTRYAVKGLSGEPMPHAVLKAGRGIANDRRYAFALARTVFDEARPAPLPKNYFLTLMKFARLAAIRSRYDDTNATLTLRDDHRELATGRLNNAADKAALETAIETFMGSAIGGRPRLVEAPGHRFTDVSVVSPEMMEAVSVINLASVRALEEKIGRAVDPVRFRGNILVDGLEPWEELGWVGKPVRIGNVSFEGALTTRRCAATEVDPTTAERNIKLPIGLQKHFGHVEMGVYLYVRSDGAIGPGDPLSA